MRGATRSDDHCYVPHKISIHAPHAGCDGRPSAWAWLRYISIHAPHAGCDIPFIPISTYARTFQSTHPMRGATSNGSSSKPRHNFNPRTPCGVRPGIQSRPSRAGIISIHAPHAGCDGTTKMTEDERRISIHAPHAGCDSPERDASEGVTLFQSTHPMRGATTAASCCAR